MTDENGIPEKKLVKKFYLSIILPFLIPSTQTCQTYKHTKEWLANHSLPDVIALERSVAKLQRLLWICFVVINLTRTYTKINNRWKKDKTVQSTTNIAIRQFSSLIYTNIVVKQNKWRQISSLVSCWKAKELQFKRRIQELDSFTNARTKTQNQSNHDQR